MKKLGFRQKVSRYFERFGLSRRLEASRPPAGALRLIVVVPAFDEDLAPLLRSLASCRLENPAAVELLLVINHPQGHPRAALHTVQVEQYRHLILPNGLPVYSLDATDLAQQEAGVGLARKLGMDAALARFGQVDHDGLVVALDSDCELSANYFEALLAAEQQPWRALSLRFAHPLAGLEERERTRIINYEIWLRYYILALRWASYPWSWHTVGSSMAVRASSYAEVGGMNRRPAGEDFYFLHKLMPGGAFGECRELCVYPAARYSLRVPFGTGRAMTEMAQGQKDFTRLYAPAIFGELSALHQSVRRGEALEQWEFWRDFLKAEPKWARRYAALAQRSPHAEAWRANFWQAWDGFMVLRFVHFRRQRHPDRTVQEAVADLWNLEREGEALLEALRLLEAAPFFKPGDGP